MEPDLIEKLVLIVVLAVVAQMIAWRLRAPGIVFLAAAGLIAGPWLGLIDPQRDFGELFQPFVSLAVAIILFEGGLHLRLSDLRRVGSAVGRMVFLGAPLAWAGAAAAGVWIAGLSWPVALLFGGILVVTGPTVIMPLLRQARLRHEPAALLKWEGIVNDPVGALLAVLVYESVMLAPDGFAAAEVFASLLAVAASAGIGYGAGRGLSAMIRRALVPEFIKGPLVLALALAVFMLGEMVQKEAGLVAVTVLGVTLANTGLAEIEQVRRLKEYVTVLLVSGLFVVLSATLDPGAVAELGWPAVGFLAALLFVVRPLSVWLATLGSGLDRRTRILAAWVAPRGIVAVAISGLLAEPMRAAGYEDAALLTPLAFAVVFTTVILHGFTLRPLGRRLGLAGGPEHGVILVGGGPFSAGLARALAEGGASVLAADRNAFRLRRVSGVEGVTLYRGEILSELAGEHVDLGAYEHLLALGEDDAYNALVCSQFATEIGARRTAQIADHRAAEGAASLRPAARGRVFLGESWDSEAIGDRLRAGWRVRLLAPGEDPRPEGAQEAAEAEDADGPLVIARVTPKGAVSFALQNAPVEIGAEDRAIAFLPPDFQPEAATETETEVGAAPERRGDGDGEARPT